MKGHQEPNIECAIWNLVASKNLKLFMNFPMTIQDRHLIDHHPINLTFLNEAPSVIQQTSFVILAYFLIKIRSLSIFRNELKRDWHTRQAPRREWTCNNHNILANWNSFLCLHDQLFNLNSTAGRNFFVLIFSLVLCPWTKCARRRFSYRLMKTSVEIKRQQRWQRRGRTSIRHASLKTFN